jgi:hypothetical protein
MMKKLFENWRTHTKEEQIDESFEQLTPENFSIALSAFEKFIQEPAVVTALLGGGVAAAVEMVKKNFQKSSGPTEPAEMNEELRDYVGGQSRSPDLQIPGYGIMTVEQTERKLARMLEEAAQDAARKPPQYSHLDGGVIQALHQALKEFREI